MLKILFLLLIVIVIAALSGWFLLRRGKRPLPESLQTGRTFPPFSTVDDNGREVSTDDLIGFPAVILFVRGNWCPFCSAQVADLTQHYRRITELGAKLIFITPKPLETTRRVAEFYDVEFDFWLDEDLKLARELGLLLEKGVPGKARETYGHDTVWPAAVVLDANNKIVFSEVAKSLRDRPSAAILLKQLEAIA